MTLGDGKVGKPRPVTHRKAAYRQEAQLSQLNIRVIEYLTVTRGHARSFKMTPLSRG